MTRRERELLYSIDTEISFLRKAIDADDPKKELRFRIGEIRRHISELATKGAQKA